MYVHYTIFFRMSFIHGLSFTLNEIKNILCIALWYNKEDSAPHRLFVQFANSIYIEKKNNN